MALTIRDIKQATAGLVTADRRLWLDADGQAVEDGDPAAKVLFCSAGARVSRSAAEAAGVTFGKPEAKEAEAAEDKAEKPAATKKATKKKATKAAKTTKKKTTKKARS